SGFDQAAGGPRGVLARAAHRRLEIQPVAAGVGSHGATKVTAMSAARDLANFLVGVTASELPPQALDHAAMLVASTIASAAMGSGLESARIITDMACSPGGSPRASVWFDASSDGGAKLPVVAAAQVNAVMSDAAPCGARAR